MAVAADMPAADSTLGFSRFKQGKQPEQILPVGEYSGFTRLIKGLRHAHQTSDKFNCELTIDKLSLRVPVPTKVQAEWFRGPKHLVTDTKQTLHKGVWICSWHTPLVLDQVTLFHNSGSSGSVYKAKDSLLRFTEVGKPGHVLGEVSVDLAEIAESELQQKTFTLPLAKSLDPTANVTLTMIMRHVLRTALSDASDSYSMAPHMGGTTTSHRPVLKANTALPPVVTVDSPLAPESARRRASQPIPTHYKGFRNRIRGRRSLQLPMGSGGTLNGEPESDQKKWYKSVRRRGRHLDSPVEMLGRRNSSSYTREVDTLQITRSSSIRANSTGGDSNSIGVDANHRHSSMRNSQGAIARQLLTLDQILKDVDIPSAKCRAKLEKRIGDTIAALQEATERAEVFETDYTARRARLMESLDNLPLSDALGTLERELVIKNGELVEFQSLRVSERQKLLDELRDVSLKLRAAEKEIKSLHATVSQLSTQNGQLEAKLREPALAQTTSDPSATVTLVFSPDDSSADAKYQTMTKSELIARIRRLETATCVKGAHQVADLEDELIQAKVKLAQSETDKERLMENGKHGIRELQTELASRSKAMEQLENQLTDLKIQSHKPKGASIRAASLFRTAAKGFNRRVNNNKEPSTTKNASS